ncbi:MAG: hypothetical protein DRH76_09975, partial [Deltaproteobacteria bacterium]
MEAFLKSPIEQIDPIDNDSNEAPQDPPPEDDTKDTNDVIFHLGSCVVKKALRMEDETISKKADEEVLLGLKTTISRNPDTPCAICYYDSAMDESHESHDEDIVALEKDMSRPTVVPINRYAGMCICKFDDDSIDSELITTSVCQHRFHTVCLYKWMKAERGGFTCPICRGGLHDQHLSGIPDLFATKPQYVVKLWPNGNIHEE